VIGVDVASGVSPTPTSRTEMMAGARSRSEALVRIARERSEPWRYFVGLEGGLDVILEQGRRLAFLETWAFVADGAGRSAYGRSGGILIPEPLAVEVLDRGTELSAAIDTYTGRRDIRDEEGAVGVLTLNLITREEALRVALISAFAPFFNPSQYFCQR
jgi:inosine/xanthosine triphosphatase